MMCENEEDFCVRGNRGLLRKVPTVFTTLVGRYCFAVSTMVSVMLVAPVEVSP